MSGVEPGRHRQPLAPRTSGPPWATCRSWGPPSGALPGASTTPWPTRQGPCAACSAAWAIDVKFPQSPTVLRHRRRDWLVARLGAVL